MSSYLATSDELTAVANKIRSKTGSSASLEWPDGFVSGINSISGGGSPNLQAKTNISPTTSSQTIEADTGYDGLSSVQINAMPTGSAATPATSITANPTISVGSGGLITASVSVTKSITPTVTEGYVSGGTAGTATVSGSATEQLAVQGVQTIHPSTSDQTIASGKYLTGAQTVKAVAIENLTAGNVKKDVVIKIGDSTDDDCVASVTGTYEGSGGGGVASGSVTPSARTLSMSFDTGLSTVNNILIVPKSEAPLKSGGKTVIAYFANATDYYRSIFITSNNSGSSFLTPNSSTSDVRFSLSGTTVTVTSTNNTGGYFEAITYDWYAW